MENFLTEHFASIVFLAIVLVVAVILFFATKGKYRKIAKRILLSLVVAAEEKFGGGTGEIKFSYVAEKLHEKLPFIVQILFTEKDIAKMIEDAVDEMKRFLTDNPEAIPALTRKDGA